MWTHVAGQVLMTVTVEGQHRMVSMDDDGGDGSENENGNEHDHESGNGSESGYANGYGYEDKSKRVNEVEHKMTVECGDDGGDGGDDEDRVRIRHRTGCPRTKIRENAWWNRGQSGVLRIQEGVGQTDANESKALRV